MSDDESTVLLNWKITLFPSVSRIILIVCQKTCCRLGKCKYHKHLSMSTMKIITHFRCHISVVYEQNHQVDMLQHVYRIHHTGALRWMYHKYLLGNHGFFMHFVEQDLQVPNTAWTYTWFTGVLKHLAHVNSRTMNHCLHLRTLLVTCSPFKFNANWSWLPHKQYNS